MQLIKLAAASLGVRVGIRSLGKRVHARPGASSEGGQASVEFALLMCFVLLPFFVGIITIGVLFNQYVELTDAVSIGARLLAVSRLQTADPCATTAAAIEHAAPFLAPANITFTIVLNGNSYSGATCPAGAANMAQGTSAQVTATYPCNFSSWGTKFASGCIMTAQTTELVQ